MTKPIPVQPQSEDIDNRPATYTGSVVHRKVLAKGTGGVSATVVVTVQRRQVWLSIVPPFTWEAIMEPRQVDELIHVLGLAREEAQQMAVVRGRPVVRGDKGVARVIANGTVGPGNKAIGTKKILP